MRLIQQLKAMQSSRDQLGILQRIDQITEELQLLRREVAALLVREAEANAKVEPEASDTEVAEVTLEEEPKVISNPNESDADAAIAGVSSLEELYSIDFVKKDEPEVEHMPEEEPTMETFAMSEPEADINELFIPRGSEEAMEKAFEPTLHFDLIDHLTIADKFLFANELCFGNQADLIDMLADIERLSSWSQVESYLYQVRGYKKDEEAVQVFATFIKEHSK